MFLTILLLTCIYTIIAIFLLKLQDVKHQLLLFIVIYILMYLFSIICRLINNKNTKNSTPSRKQNLNNKEPHINTFRQELQNVSNTNIINTNDHDLTHQKVNVKQERLVNEMTSGG